MPSLLRSALSLYQLIGILEYPNGSSKTLWLPDTIVKYLSEAHSSVHCSCSHSPGWFGLHCSSLLTAVAPLSTKMEDSQMVKESKDTDFH